MFKERRENALFGPMIFSSYVCVLQLNLPLGAHLELLIFTLQYISILDVYLRPCLYPCLGVCACVSVIYTCSHTCLLIFVYILASVGTGLCVPANVPLCMNLFRTFKSFGEWLVSDS